jgi:hypothetical protein
MGELISFFEALDGLGKTNRERAKAINVPLRTFYDLKRAKLHSQVRMLLRNADLLEALLEDARAGRTNGHHTADAQPAEQG